MLHSQEKVIDCSKELIDGDFVHSEIALNVIRGELWSDKLEVYVGYMSLYSNACCNVDWS